MPIFPTPEKRHGGSMLEYIVILAFCVVVVAVSAKFLGFNVRALYENGLGVNETPSNTTTTSSGNAVIPPVTSTTKGTDPTTTPKPATTGGAWLGNPDLSMSIANGWVTPENPSSRQENLTFLNKSANPISDIAPYVVDASTTNITTTMISTDCPSTLQGWETCTATVQTTATMNGTSQATLYAKNGEYPESIGGVISAYTQPYIAELIGEPGVGPTPTYTFSINTPGTQGWHVIAIANDLKTIMVSGNLPPGMSMEGMDNISSNSTQTGINLTGTPTEAGTWTFDIVMRTRSQLSTTQPITVTVSGSKPLTWGNGNTTTASVNKYYAQSTYYLGLTNPNTSEYSPVNIQVSGDGYSLESACSSISAYNGYCQVVVHFQSPAAVNGTYKGTVSAGSGQPSLTLNTTVTGY